MFLNFYRERFSPNKKEKKFNSKSKFIHTKYLYL